MRITGPLKGPCNPSNNSIGGLDIRYDRDNSRRKPTIIAGVCCIRAVTKGAKPPIVTASSKIDRLLAPGLRPEG